MKRPMDVGRSWDRSVHTCVGLVGGGPRRNSRSVGIPRHPAQQFKLGGLHLVPKI